MKKAILDHTKKTWDLAKEKENMTKENIAKELQEEFKKGNLKPSQLKRSKSTENLTPTKPEIPLTKSKSVENILANQPSLSEQVKQLKEEAKFWNTTAQNYLANLQKITPELDQVKEENKKLKETNNNLVDRNNELRLQALKDFDKIREGEKDLEKAAEEFVNTDQKRINLQVQNKQLLREKQDLESRLQNANERVQNLYNLKGLPNNLEELKETNFDWWTEYGSIISYALVYLLFIWLLSKNNQKQQE